MEGFDKAMPGSKTDETEDGDTPTPKTVSEKNLGLTVSE